MFAVPVLQLVAKLNLKETCLAVSTITALYICLGKFLPKIEKTAYILLAYQDIKIFLFKETCHYDHKTIIFFYC